MIIKENINERIDRPERVSEVLESILSFENEVDRDKEHFWVIGLDVKMAVKYIELVTLGLLNQSLVAPREVFRMAIMKGVAGIVVVHNHPSNLLEPSQSDINVTKRLVESGEILTIPVYDHVIINGDGESFYSFKANDLI